MTRALPSSVGTNARHDVTNDRGGGRSGTASLPFGKPARVGGARTLV